MADENQQGDKTEEATPERRDEFREQGRVVSSKEVTATLGLLGLIVFISVYSQNIFSALKGVMTENFRLVGTMSISKENIIGYSINIWKETLYLCIPIFGVTAAISILVTLLQTRFNFSMHKLTPELSKLNPIEGFKKLFSLQAGMELLKSIGKLTIVGMVAFSVIYGEIKVTPGLLNTSLIFSWMYWAKITKSLLWTVAGLLVIVALIDYLFNFFQLEKQLKMSKQEVKEEFKRREVDPHLKGRMRRMAREMISRKMVKATKEATVLITNPTHYSIALKYELGMPAPILVAKGVDFLALRMREIAKEGDIPIVENKLLARSLYATVEIGSEIPESLYKAVSEVIKYVFKIKNIRVNRNKARA